MGTASTALWLAASACLAAWGLLLLVRYVRWRIYWHGVLRPFGGFPLALPFVGSLLYVLGPMDTLLERGLRFFSTLGDGNYFGLWLGERPWLHLIRPEDIEGVLSSGKQIHKPDIVYATVSGFFGRGLISLNGDAWRHHRRVLTPAFHFAVLERYAPIFTTRAAAFADKLVREEADGRSLDFVPLTSALVTDTVMETAFGLQGLGDKFHDTAERREFIKAADTAFQIIAQRIVKPWLMLEWVFRCSALGRQQRKADHTIDTYARRVIKMKREQLRRRTQRGAQDDADADSQARSAVGCDEDDEGGVRRKHTFLDLVMEQDLDVLSDEGILHEVRTLIAVQQTSASTLGFVAVCLALNPEVQRLARAEVLRVDAEQGLTALERLNRLKYVERVIKETLRLFPITALFARTLGEDLVLKDAPTKQGVRTVTLPAGLNVTLFIYSTHRDPRHWPQPLVFDPDRFLAERSQGRHPYAYVPFSAGSRNCIGQRYAMLQMKAVTAAMLRRVEIQPGDNCEHLDELPLGMNTFLYIRGGFNVRLRPLTADDAFD